MKVFSLFEYIIVEKDESFTWLLPAENLWFQGEAFLLEKADCLLLSPYEDIVALEDSYSPKQKWDKTKYYCFLSDSGSLSYYYTSNNIKLQPDEEKLVSNLIGCTSHYQKK
ncbi:hypothetical protein LF845_05165 [Deferribacterales bacterium Es71-Z0220]|jgi:hypothetical protein|uniref:hypothetical protein n=1 Tax=Deferrivibrio essentukiensis TaxID=2880922 RepID=UPI001F612D53|nr:hypothetical protein [Deferrivibrio essentukiensis]MBZ4672119.1 hypothetical protein [Deferribacteraceae bacterium]MCB4204349.1 hypothetical protein [Deferrivibrio essentukiensis]